MQFISKQFTYTCLFFIGISILIYSCKKQPNKLKNGIWKAELIRDDGKSIVFNLEIADSNNHQQIFITDEKMSIDSLELRNDSVFIFMPFFDSYFACKIVSSRELQGKWYKNKGDHYESMPFRAIYGKIDLFAATLPGNQDISGTWNTQFIRPNGSNFQGIGLFKQQGNQVTGTFFTPSGDFRFLQGVVTGDTLKLSGFDGSHAFYFQALVHKNELTDGKVYSYNNEPNSWHAVRQDYKALPENFAVQPIAPQTVKLNFSLKDMRTGQSVSLNDDRYRNKVVVLQMLGSWCPNCMDEAPFMIDYYNKNRDKGLEFIAIDFERTVDFDKSKRAIHSFLKRFDFDYPIVHSGVAASDPDLTDKIFPGLPVKVTAFPTSIFIDRAGYVRFVHGGFNGPATGKFYTQFKQEFNDIVTSLLTE